MIQIRSLVKVYPGPVTALQGVDLDVPVGMFGLLGPNGAGKTTLMRILAGLLEPTSGTATLDGEDILSRPERVRARLGYLPQEFGFYPHLSGQQMLIHLLRLKGVEAPGGLKRLASDLEDSGATVTSVSGGLILGDGRIICLSHPFLDREPCSERARRLADGKAAIAVDLLLVLRALPIASNIALAVPNEFRALAGMAVRFLIIG